MAWPDAASGEPEASFVGPEDGDEQEDAVRHPTNRDALLAEIDLHLRAGRRFDPHRGERGRALGLPDGRNGPRHRPHVCGRP